ncbi:hypothetical protein EYF80_027378 [Liparis tanakae]|uniref:Uncharacterized protein n=1 Tax=Liparis tanakae TaxID=230148 RepID=A0A4Z2H8Z8_9TELE|nr:hypothetical protein EYF80_027378 [Liparis tanakae]
MAMTDGSASPLTRHTTHLVCRPVLTVPVSSQVLSLLNTSRIRVSHSGQLWGGVSSHQAAKSYLIPTFLH